MLSHNDTEFELSEDYDKIPILGYLFIFHLKSSVWLNDCITKTHFSSTGIVLCILNFLNQAVLNDDFELSNRLLILGFLW